MPEETTYIMSYRCHNCNMRFQKGVPMGVRAIGQGGCCPYCGVRDYLDDDGTNTHKVLSFVKRQKKE